MNAPVAPQQFATTPDRTGLVPPDRDASAWPVPPAGKPIRWGSDEHRNLFAHTLLDTFDAYRPALIDWPRLEPDALRRVTSLPIWDIAVQTEGKAGTRMQNYADGCADPLVRKALDLNAFEERRHKVVLSGLVEAYGIPLEPEPEYKVPKDREWAYMVTGLQRVRRQLLRLRPVRDRPPLRLLPSRTGGDLRGRWCTRRAATSCSSPTGWSGAGRS